MNAGDDSVLTAVVDFLARLGDAEARVDELKRAMTLQRQCTGRMAALTVREHRKAQKQLDELVSRLQ